ncbi:MAG: transglycosylase domain-containing protein [Defluviitaleaceae bacterium]|nr:transglycosylase domain-containing protein [Defluviitaleaceae bacterium]
MDYSTLGNKNRRRSPHATRVRNKISLLTLRIVLAIVLIVGFAAFGMGMGLYLGILRNSPPLNVEALFTGGMIDRTSVIVNLHTGEELERLHAGQNHEFVTIDQIPLHVQHAFVAIEDERFFEHNGVDIRAMGRAAHVVFTGGGVQGASTITQQLIKNMLERFDSNLIYKLQEQYLAVNFERHLAEMFEEAGYENPRQRSKDFILEHYLNIINLGRSNLGVQAAAMFYYGVDVSELTIAQAATIAAITQNPSRFPPDTRPQNNWERAQVVLYVMHRNGFITDAEFEEAMEEVELEDGTMIGAVYSTIFRTEGGGLRPILSEFDCFTDALLDQVRDDLMREFNITREMADQRIFRGGLTIYSNQDLGIQAIVDRAFLDDSLWPGPNRGFSVEVEYHMTVFNTITQQRRHYERRHTASSMAAAEEFIYNLQAQLLTASDEIEFERRFLMPQPQGAFVLIDHHTGDVVALRGIRGPKEGNRVFNRATQATRSPGSQLKPLAFAAAFDLGIMQPGTIIDDVPFTLVNTGGAPWTPGNHWGSTFEGHMSVRRAIYRSANVVSARAVADTTIPHLGVPAFHAYLTNMGISTLHENDGAAVVLGGMTNGVHLIELTGAYAAVANLGEFNRPMLYSRVLDYDGNILLENREGPQRVLSRNAAYLTIHSMLDTVTVGTGGRANWSSTQLRRDIPIAGKTGTSQRNTDLGFVGSTPYFTAAFWIGNDNSQGMHRQTNQYHTPLWRHIMEEIHTDLPPRQFERPDTIRTATVCRDSGHLAGELCRHDPRGNRTRTEVFAAGLAPTQVCQVHQQFTFCTISERLAGHFCPPQVVSTRVGLVRVQPIDHLTGAVADRAHEVPLAVRQGLVCHIHDAFYTGNWYDDMPNDFDNGYGEDYPETTAPGDWVSPFPNLNQPPSQGNQENNQTIPPSNGNDTQTQAPPPEAPVVPLPPADTTTPPEDVDDDHDSSWVTG